MALIVPAGLSWHGPGKKGFTYRERKREHDDRGKVIVVSVRALLTFSAVVVVW